MKGSLAVAMATGALVVVAYGGFAMAVEAEDPSDPVVAVVETAELEPSSEESSDDASSLDDLSGENGLICVLVPIEAEETETEETEEPETEEPEPATIEQLLEVNEIECGGTGNERSASVALLPRYLAHSDEFTGAEKGAAISAWAKTHANKKSREDDAPVDGDEEAPGDVEGPSEEEPSKNESSPGQSGNAPGHSGNHPGNGRGR